MKASALAKRSSMMPRPVETRLSILWSTYLLVTTTDSTLLLTLLPTTVVMSLATSNLLIPAIWRRTLMSSSRTNALISWENGLMASLPTVLLELQMLGPLNSTLTTLSKLTLLNAGASTSNAIDSILKTDLTRPTSLRMVSLSLRERRSATSRWAPLSYSSLKFLKSPSLARRDSSSTSSPARSSKWVN